MIGKAIRGGKSTLDASLPIGQLPIGPCTVFGGAIASIGVRSDVIFKPHRFVYGGPRGTFDILDVKVGKNSQWVSSGGVPADCFPPYPDYLKAVAESGELSALYFELLEKLENLRCDIIQVAMDFTFIVKNRTSEAAEFGGIVYGRYLDASVSSYYHAYHETKVALPVSSRAPEGAKPALGDPLPTLINETASAGGGVRASGLVPVLKVCGRCLGTGGENGICGACGGSGSVKRYVDPIYPQPDAGESAVNAAGSEPIPNDYPQGSVVPGKGSGD